MSTLGLLAIALGIALGGAVSVLQIKKSFFSDYSEIWNGFWVGLILILISSGFIVTHQLANLATQTWFLLPMVACFFGGLFLTIRGIKQYLVFGIMLRQENIWNLKQMACLKKISSTAEKSVSIPDFLKENFIFLMDNLGYKWGGIFKTEAITGEQRLVFPYGVNSDQALQLYHQARKSFSAEPLTAIKVMVQENPQKIAEIPELLTSFPQLAKLALIPLQHKERVLGWGLVAGDKQANSDYKTVQFLTLWGQVMAQKVELFSSTGQEQNRQQYLKVLEEISELLQTNLKLEEAIPHLAKSVQKVQDFQYFSLSVLDTSGENMRRFTLGASGNLLLEKGVNLPTHNSDLVQVLQSGEIIIDTDYSTSPRYAQDQWFRNCGCRSRLVVPLRNRKRIWGALTLGHLKPGFFQFQNLKELKLLFSQITLLLIRTHYLEELVRKEKLDKLLKESVEVFEEKKDLKVLLEKTAQKVASQFPVSFCKIMLLDSHRQNLKPYALYKLRDSDMQLEPGQDLDLSQLPWHRLALESKRTQLIKQDDPESVMSSQEARLALSEKIESALLIPILMEDKPVGIMALGELRNWSRRPFKKDEIVLASSLAFQTSQALRQAWLDYKLQESKSRRALDPEGWAKEILDLKYDINNPLTSIFGASELLQIREKNLTEESMHYLRIIERNARRIQETLEKIINRPEQPQQVDWENLTVKPSP